MNGIGHGGEGSKTLDAAVEAARTAGALLRKEFHRPGGPRGTRSHADVDTEAERLIQARLAEAYPEDGFLGEESGPGWSHAGGNGRLWVVDPNDGTRAYTAGFRGSAVSIALLERGKPVLGVVYAFNYPDDDGDLISWIRGGPVRRNGQPVHRNWPAVPGAACTVLLSHDADKNPAANLRATAPMRYRALPSIAYRLALTAVGEGDAAVSLNGPVTWDLAAGHALLLASGGDLYRMDGDPIRYSPSGSCSGSTQVFGGAKPLVEHLRRRDWTRVFERPSGTEPFGLCRPKAGSPWVETGVLSRAQGCLLGQLAGDALGSLVEFQSPERIRQDHPGGIRDLADGGAWNTLAGQPTDDSEMALLLARVLVNRDAYDAEEARRAYVYWLHSGPFDCGATVASGLRGRPNPESQANGALMRVSPLGIFAAGREPRLAARWAMEDARLTHPHPVCQHADALFTMAVAQAVTQDHSPEDLYRKILGWAEAPGVPDTLREAVKRASKRPPADYLHRQGWVLIAFQNALWQLLHAPNAEEGVIDTVSRGGDTDTNAAICGALLGAVYGRRALPPPWVRCLLSCRPSGELSQVKHPRPECFWPVDVLLLAERLVSHPASTD